ncbi:uncharacterized protein LOC132601413 [Lycium barbarum]|uniref:uncharacterized protein LOC132601413 n=1 Tax=Lycium barbarum TaxID=112863 RepID=UPI00293EAC50|nr:uncharacterized protein LOC132601413 [Lycium barbarum]
MFNWRTVNQKPSVNYLMLGMFKDGEIGIFSAISDISCKFNNIVPTISEVEKLGLRAYLVNRHAPPPQTHQEEENEYADFTTTPPHIAAAKKTQKNDASKSPPHKKPRKMSTAALLVQKSPTTIPKKTTVGQSSKKSASVVDKPVQSKEKNKAAPSVHRVPVDDVSTSKSVDLASLRQELNQFKQEVLAEFKVVFTELKDLRKTIDKNFKKVLEHVKGKQNSEKDDDSETHIPLHDGNIHQQPDDYMDHGDDIHMETDTGDVHPTEHAVHCFPYVFVYCFWTSSTNTFYEKGLAPDIQVGIGNDSGDTLKASTEEIALLACVFFKEKGIAPDIQVDIGNESGDTMEASTEEIAEGGDLSGEPKTSAERSGKHTMEEQKCSDDSNNSEMIAQVLANIAELEMTNEQVHAEITEENTSSTIDPITGPLDVQMVDEYRTWLRNERTKKTVTKKKWQFLTMESNSILASQLSMIRNGFTCYRWMVSFGMTRDGCISRHSVCCVFVKYREHIDVIFYYFRKKGKYDKRNNFSFTTVDCLFKQRIDVVHHAYRNVETHTNVANEEQVLIEYVKGHRLIANVPWHTVDNVLIPVNIQEENHWRLYVYNSYQSAGHNTVVRNEIKKLPTLLSHFLHLAGFYVNKKSIDLVKDPAYADKGHIDILEVVYVDNLPHQTAGST